MTDTIVFTFGRFQPPGLNHEKLVVKVLEQARANRADHMVYLSHSHNTTTDPLEWAFKSRACQAAFPGVKFCTEEAIKTPFHALESLALGYKNVIFVVGQDRLNEFTERMTPYAEQWGLENFKIVSAGARNPKASGITGMSGSKMRQYVAEGNKESFYNGLPQRLTASMKEQVFLNTQKGLKKTNI